MKKEGESEEKKKIIHSDETTLYESHKTLKIIRKTAVMAASIRCL